MSEFDSYLVKLLNPLPAEELRSLLYEYKNTKDIAIREKIILQFEVGRYV